MEVVPALVLAVLGVALSPWLARLVADPPLREPSDERLLHLDGRPLLVVTAVLTAGSLAAVGAQYGWVWPLLPLVVLCPALVVMSLVDLTIYRIPDKVLFPTLGLCALLVVLVSVVEDVSDAALWAFAGAGVSFLLLFIPALVYPAGMGLGDVKLVVLLGLFTGWFGWSGEEAIGAIRLSLLSLAMGCVLGILAGLVLLAVRRKRTPFPFGPALALAALVCILFPSELLAR